MLGHRFREALGTGLMVVELADTAELVAQKVPTAVTTALRELEAQVGQGQGFMPGLKPVVRTEKE
jgi:hypothetical protein